MADVRPSVRNGEVAAHDRDEEADRRDRASQARDEAADRRDVDAAERQRSARGIADDLESRLGRLHRDLLDHLARIEDTIVDPADRPSLTPQALAVLCADAAKRRAVLDDARAAVAGLVEETYGEIRRHRSDLVDSANDRRVAAWDRADSAGDRRSSAGDRDLSLRDRSQRVIEREQVDDTDLGSRSGADPAAVGETDPAARIRRSRRRIDGSRERLFRTDDTGTSAPPLARADDDRDRTNDA